MADKHDLRHVVSDEPRVMVVDGSKLVRRMISDTLLKELPGAHVVGCGDLGEARKALSEGTFDLVTTALVLPDGDGLALARVVREAAGQAYVPVIVVSGNAQEALETRVFTEDITDYFDKSLGHTALVAFIRGYVHPAPIEGARVLYVEDSKVVAVATRRMLERQNMQVAPGSPTFERLISDAQMRNVEVGLKFWYGMLKGGGINRSIKVLMSNLPGYNDAEKAQVVMQRASLNPELMKHLLETPAPGPSARRWNSRLNQLMGLQQAGAETTD